MLDRRIVILYGSQTGTAQDVAERIWREAKFFKFSGPVDCMDNYSVSNLIYETLIVFVAATTGQGEEPDNMKMFWRFLLRRSLPPDSLKNVRYAVLGLGDSSYVKFNFVAKRLHKRLLSLGGNPVIDPGFADDQHDLGADAVVDKWLTQFWRKIGDIYNFTIGAIALKLEPRWRVVVLDKLEGSDEKGSNDLKKYSQRTPCEMHMIENERATAQDHFQDVRLIKLQIPDSLQYNAGDVLMIVPQNSDQNVKLLFEIINRERKAENFIRPESLVQVMTKDSDLPIPEALRLPISLEECAKKYWDLNIVPRRHTFALLAQVTSNDLEKEKLQEFSEAAGQEDLYNYCNRPRRIILEVLADFPFAAQAINLDMLFDVLQPIKPRAFSIASSLKMHPNEIHVLLAVVQYKTKLQALRQGLCSTYLSSLPIGSVLHGWVQPGSFRYPSPSSSVIMVGPGTGVAPFRSYIQELVATKNASASNLVLFFGCRNRNADFYFHEEWQRLIETQQLTVVPAFSRDQPDKIYVQHQIVQHGADVWQRLQKDGYVLIAGSSKNMPASVREAFVKVVQEYGGFDPDGAENYIRQLEKSGRYQTETWS